MGVAKNGLYGSVTHPPSLFPSNISVALRKKGATENLRANGLSGRDSAYPISDADLSWVFL